MQIRAAEDDDWPAIYTFFSAIVAAGESYAFPADLSLDAARPWWMETAPGQTVVAVDGETILGSAEVGPNRPGRGSHVATASFMVDPAHQGRGVGRSLGIHVLEWARLRGYRSMQFNAADSRRLRMADSPGYANRRNPAGHRLFSVQRLVPSGSVTIFAVVCTDAACQTVLQG